MQSIYIEHKYSCVNHNLYHVCRYIHIGIQPKKYWIVANAKQNSGNIYISHKDFIDP